MKTSGVVAFAFGTPNTILSNRRIAEIASNEAKQTNGMVYTQFDMAAIEEGIPVDYIEEEPGSPPPTLRIARGAVQWAKQNGLTELWIAAAKPHLWRALRDVQSALREDGSQQIEVRVCAEIGQYPEDSWFCLDSTQARAQSREAWERRERILKLMPFFVYKLVAS